MLDVLYLDVNAHIKKFRRAVCDLKITDISRVITNNSAQAAQTARCVAHDKRNSSQVEFIDSFFIPGYIDPPLRRAGEIFKRFAVDGVNGHAPALGDDAHNAIPGQRMTTASKVQRHPWDHALNGNPF